MILKPRLQDVKTIGYYLGKIIFGLSLTAVMPLAVAAVFREAGPFLDFLIFSGISMISGLVLIWACKGAKDPSWMDGMIVVSLSWLAAMFLGAIPMHLSGHWASYLDSCFDSMSGFATTGLTLVQDLDHLSRAHNFWRHFIMFLGGQGIVIIALSFFVKSAPGAFRMYVGEARDERILPNVIHTSRFIWLVGFVYMVLGTTALGVAGIMNGMNPVNALFHGACIFMAAFDTGGFAPQSQNILYYHSFSFEIITAVLMILGAINFKLHYHIWAGHRREIFKNIETITMFLTVAFTLIIVLSGLVQAGAYQGTALIFRKGFYQLISAHTGTGFQTIYAQKLGADWNDLSLVGLFCAMALGGAVCSTTGAIKMLRLGIIFKGLAEDLKKIILPEKAVIAQKFHHIKEIFLDDKQARSALFISLCYILLYFGGALAGMYYGHPFLRALFESTSAAANVGLSCGITSPGMPNALKVVYIIQMWAGRLEFMAVFTLLGFFVAIFKGKK